MTCNKLYLRHRLVSEYKQMPAHWLKDLHVYSLEELVAVKRGELLVRVKTIVTDSITHISQCQVCIILALLLQLRT